MKFLINAVRVAIYMHLRWLFRKNNLYVVCGMRRSGNHACINWLLNALEERESSFEEVKGDRCYISNSGKTFFLNEANFYGLNHYWKLVIEQKKVIKSCTNVIISLEDFEPSSGINPFIIASATKIMVTRSLLNLIASRLQRAMNQAKEGKDRGDMSVRESFFSNLNWIMNNKTDKSWLFWSFDEWLQNSNQCRQQFLQRLGLAVNLTPAMSLQGGGSSFTGQRLIPTAEEIESRWDNIQLPSSVIKLINQNPQLLTEQEQLYISKLLNPSGNIDTNKQQSTN